MSTYIRWVYVFALRAAYQCMGNVDDNCSVSLNIEQLTHKNQRTTHYYPHYSHICILSYFIRCRILVIFFPLVSSWLLPFSLFPRQNR